MQSMLILDMQGVIYPAFQLQQLTQQFEKILLVYKKKEENKFDLHDLKALTLLVSHQKLDLYGFHGDGGASEDLMNYAFLIGELKNNLKSITVSSKNPNLSALKMLGHSNLEIILDFITPSVLNTPIAESESTDINYQGTKSTTSEAIPSTPDNTENDYLPDPDSDEGSFGDEPMGNDKYLLDNCEYVFSNQAAKDNFLLKASQCAEYLYKGSSETQLTDLVNTSDMTPNSLLNGGEILKVVRVICLELAKRNINALNTEALRSIVSKELTSDITCEEVVDSLEKYFIGYFNQGSFILQKSFILFFIKNNDYSYLDQTLERYTYLFSDSLYSERYNQMIEMGRSVSPRDMSILSSLSQILLTAPSYQARPNEVRLFKKAMQSSLNCSESEADYTVSLLKRYEVISLDLDNSGCNLTYDDAKMLRISTLRPKDVTQHPRFEQRADSKEDTKKKNDPFELLSKTLDTTNKAESEDPEEEFQLTSESFDLFKQVLGRLKITHLPKTKKELISYLKTTLQTHDVAFDIESFYKEIERHWIFETTAYNSEDDDISISITMMNRLALAHEYEEFKAILDGIIDYSMFGSSKADLCDVDFFKALAVIPRNTDQRPKIEKGLVGLFNRTLNDEDKAKKMFNRMLGIKVFIMNGKRIEFSDSAITYWKIKAER